ncbi:hypothetical protein U6J50_12285, partial [Cutibacterium acnes]
MSSYLFRKIREIWSNWERTSLGSAANRTKADSATREFPRSSLFPYRFKGIEHPKVLDMIIECLQPGLAADVAERLDGIRKL